MIDKAENIVYNVKKTILKESQMIESIILRNFKAFRNAEMKDIPPFCVIVGANGSGKSTIFNVLGFLKDAMASNVNVALSKLGGSRGLQEVRTRGAAYNESVEITLKFRNEKVVNDKNKQLLITYQLKLNERNGRAYVEQEILSYRRGSKGQPWRFLDFSDGKGKAVTNEAEKVSDVNQLDREEQSLKSNDILAIKGLAQFERFPAVVALGELIENWYVSDFHISKARPEQEANFAEHLSREGENLSLVVEYLYKHHPDKFAIILDKMKKRIPGINHVEAKTTEEGRVLLKFQDGAFEDPFLAKFVSDGTIKMLAYLVLLNDPKPYPLLCVEEPENQLYPKLLQELAEEFREYANRGEQVMVSTHSPDFLNAARLDEVFWLEKKDGYTEIRRASDNEQIKAFMEDGDQMGYLWNQGFFGDVDPK
ncbi:MAG: AAA family ATPase [Fusobacteriaceae bacterium]|jgi:predicted ATPase|nr:AAA family ATPase [Fusobacteriaceae bacterium]